MKNVQDVATPASPRSLVARLGLLGALCLLSLATQAACNTTEGVGKDIESAGDALSDTARDARD